MCSLYGSDAGVCCLPFLWTLNHGYFFPYEIGIVYRAFRCLGTFSARILRGLIFKRFPPGRIYVFQSLLALRNQGHCNVLPRELFFFQSTPIVLCGGLTSIMTTHFVVINSSCFVFIQYQGLRQFSLLFREKLILLTLRSHWRCSPVAASINVEEREPPYCALHLVSVLGLGLCPLNPWIP